MSPILPRCQSKRKQILGRFDFSHCHRPQAGSPCGASASTGSRSIHEKIETKPIEVAIGSSLKDMKISERDVAKGIWVRVIDKTGKEVGTLISPPTLAKKFTWKE